jgi:hypothetical protein
VKMETASWFETLVTNDLKHGVHVLDFCGLHQHCCENAHVPHSLSVLGLCFIQFSNALMMIYYTYLALLGFWVLSIF